MNGCRYAIREYASEDKNSLVELVALSRGALSVLRGKKQDVDISTAYSELQEYIDKKYPIFVATIMEEGRNIGYLVCKVDGDTVWAESLFVLPEFRRQGVAGMLYGTAEKLAQTKGQATLYNWVHPNNDAIIAFLGERGYNVLNLIEIRRKLPGEETKENVQVGNHNYAYAVRIQK